MGLFSIYDKLKYEFDNYKYKLNNFHFINNQLANLIKKLYNYDVFNNLISISNKIDNLNSCMYFEINVDNFIFKIKLLQPSSDIEITKKIHFICYMMKKIYSDFNDYKEVIITAYLYDHPRTLNNAVTFDDLTRINNFNCPSGFTYKNNIVLTRINGFCGLLIHELIHFFKNDGREINNYQKYDEKYKIIFNKYISNSEYGYLFEGITNIKTTLYSVLFKAVYNNYRYSKLVDLLYEEYIRSATLCYKIIKFLNCETFYDMIKNKKFTHYGSTFEYSFVKFYIFFLFIHNQIFDPLELNENDLKTIVNNMEIICKNEELSELDMRILFFDNNCYELYKNDKNFKLDDKDVEYYIKDL
jgi:hypothetical protein